VNTRAFLPIVTLTLAGCAAVVAACAAPAPETDEPAAPDAGVLALTPEQVASAGVRTELSVASEVRQTIRVPGSVDTPDTERAAVGAILAGRVARVLVLPGEVVRAGQPLVELHGHELFDAQAALTAAEAQMEVARAAAGRAERLHEAGAIPLEELQQRRAGLTAAEAELRRATEMVEHLAPTEGGNASAVAPTAGTVFSVEVSPGQVVLPGTPLVMLGSTDRLWVTAFVPEGVSSGMQPGDEASVEFLSAPATPGRARLISAARNVDAATRSVEMRFELLDPPPAVRPGSYATVRIGSTAALTGVELPEDAAVRMGSGDVVFIEVAPGQYEPVPVTVMLLGDGRVAVQGLEAGLPVVVEGAYFLKSVAESGQGAAGEDG